MLVFLSGCVVSCGVLLALAGAGKVYRGARRTGGSTAIWRALRIPRPLINRAEVAAGVLECLIGALVCTRLCPVAAGVAMALLGAAFCVLLGYVRIKRIPGDCGCVGLRKRADAIAETVTWRAMARAGLLAAAGVTAAVESAGRASMFFYAGLLTGGAVLALLSMRLPVRTPGCRRALWRPVRSSMRALTAHEVFASMASAAGPFGSDVRYRRSGCTDEFWYPAGAGGDKAVVFRLSRGGPAGSLAVHAAVQASTRGNAWLKKPPLVRPSWVV
ncbi:MAG: MauE/DoxX family redox-associated membrane protein [Streptosporangiaceae bacterium]|jgi:hypothetical protein